MREVRISYIIDSDDMTDSEFENQEAKTFIITECDMEQIIKERIYEKGNIQIEQIKLRQE